MVLISNRAAFTGPAPNPALWKTTVALTMLIVLASGVALFVSQKLIIRHIASSEHVISSLRVETSVLEQQQDKDALPAHFFEAETKHIGEQIEQESRRLDKLGAEH